MASNNKYYTSPGYNDLFQFESFEDELEHETHMISFTILSEIEKMLELRKISRKELALRLGVSPSYVTQLFRGNKLLNIEMIAKLNLLFGLKFDIQSQFGDETKACHSVIDHEALPDAIDDNWYIIKRINTKPKYSKTNNLDLGETTEQQVA